MACVANRKVLLISPSAKEMQASAISQAGYENIGLGYLSSYLRKNKWNVEVLNLDVIHNIKVVFYQEDKVSLNDDIALILEKICSNPPALIGISVTMMSINDSLLISRAIKNRYPNMKICLGGNHASICCEEILNNESTIDFVVIGDGEIFFHQLLEEVVNDGKYEHIPNLAYRTTSKKVIINKSKLINQKELNSFPFPARDDLKLLQQYFKITEARISTSRGCNGHCTFCCDTVLNPQRIWIPKDPKLVVDEIEHLYNNYGIGYFWINDDNFITSTSDGRKRAQLIAEEIINRKLEINYRALFRPDAFIESDPLLSLLKRSGLHTAYIGFESSSQSKLKRFGKNIAPSNYYRIVRELKENNIGVQVGFIMFDPFTTFDDLYEDAIFLHKIGQLYLFTNFTQMLDVFPQTPISKIMKNKGLINKESTYKSNNNDYHFVDTRVEVLANFLNDIYKRKLSQIDRNMQRIRLFGSSDFSHTHLDAVVDAINNNNYQFLIEIISDCKNSNFDEIKFETLVDAVIEKNNQLLSSY